VLSESRYRVRTSNENSTIIVDNGMLRLEANSDGTRPGRAALDLIEQTNFVQAVLKLDSSSMAEGNGMARVMVSGTMYNDRRPGGVENGGSLGDVLIQLSLRMRGDGTLDNLFCAFRSDDADFGNISAVQLDGFTECGRFDTEIQLGVPYTASIFLDMEERKLVFKLDGSTIEHVIRGNIFEPTSTAVSSVVAQSNGVGRAVAFADDLSNSPDAAPAEDPMAEEPVAEDPAVDSGEAAGDEANPDAAADENAEQPADDQTLEELLDRDSGSGCSIGNTSSNDPMFAGLLSLAVLVLGIRRKSVLKLNSVSGQS